MYREEGIFFHEALFHFGPERNDQSEVVLDVKILRLEEISGFSGRSSFEGLCRLVGATTDVEKDEFWRHCLEKDHQPDLDVCWLTEEGTWKVLDRFTDRLEEILNKH